MRKPEPILTVLLCGDGAEISRLYVKAVTYPELNVIWRPGSSTQFLACDLSLCAVVVMSQSLARATFPTGAEPWPYDHVPVLIQFDADVPDIRRTELLRSGVAGFLEPGCEPQQLTEAVTRVCAGELWVSRRMLSVAVQQIFQESHNPRLTPREREIFELLGAGCSNRDIAEQLFITRETVRWHLRCLYTKLGVHDRASIIALVDQGGPIPTRTAARIGVGGGH